MLCLSSLVGNMSDVKENSFLVKRYDRGLIIVPVPGH